MRLAGRGRVTGLALRHRSGQAIALFVLSLLGVAACSFGPLYERAVEAAQLKLALADTPIFSRGITALTTPTGSTTDVFAADRTGISRFYGSPVTWDHLGVRYAAVGTKIVTNVVSRPGQCQHLPVAQGRCPTSPFEVMVSTSSAKALGLRVGNRIRATSEQPSSASTAVSFTLTVVGEYGPYDPHNDFWFDNGYFSPSGRQLVLVGQDSFFGSDALLAGDGFGVAMTAKQLSVNSEIDVPLRVDRVGLDDISALRKGVAALIAAGADPESGVTVSSNLSSVLDQVEEGRRQARSVIPALAAEMALLVLVVIGIVVVAGADQRRPEFALARLRGRSSGRTARLFAREFGVPIALSIVPGVLLAWLASSVVDRSWLSGGARPELRMTVLAAAGAVALVELLVVAVAVRATARAPVHELIRRVPVRTSRHRVGIGEAALAAAAIAGTVVVLSGDRRNLIAVVTPGLIALVAGMVLSHVLALVARRTGGRSLWRGRLAVGLAGLQIARRPGVRRIVVLLCVACALAVSAADEWQVSARNRSVRAGAEVGASVALRVRAGSVEALERAVAAADPSGRYATPVVIEQPVTGPAVVAVSPASFKRIAAWGWPRDRRDADLVSRLSPTRPPAVTLRGTSLQLRLASISLSRVSLTGDATTRAPVSLLLHLYPASGPDVYVKVGPLPDRGGGPATLSASAPCAEGCRLAQISILRPTSDEDGVFIDAAITGLYAGRPGAYSRVPLGATAEWGEATPETPVSHVVIDNPQYSVGKISLSSAAGGGIQLTAFHMGAPEVLQHLDVPVAVPALVADGVAPVLDQRGFLPSVNIDGNLAPFRPVGQVAFVPGSLGPALLVDADLAAAVATPTLGDSTTAIWLAADNPARERALVASLRQHGVAVVSRDTAARHRAVLAAAAPAWAMQLAIVTALLAVLIAALVILISATMSRRSRAADAAALGLVGVDLAWLRRATLIEHLVAVVAGVVVGSAIGVVGAQMALPGTPIFLVDFQAPAIVRDAAWGAISFAAALAMAALVVTSVGTSLALVRRVATQRPGRPVEAEQ